MHQPLLHWYSRHRRDLPWRVAKGYPSAYHVLVSELMLQQTQVATVIPYFKRFIERYPTAADLAGADEQEVLRLWQGLGYYSRARNLQNAARVIVSRHGGRVPRDLEQLLELPGIGRYTAGAIASLAYGERAPILDGNVQRVICRVDAITGDPRDPAVRSALWSRSEQMLPEKRIADFNSALMELGATICTPRNPQCPICPIQEHCQAASRGLQDQIPPAKKPIRRPVERRWVLCIEHDGQWLIEQRPPTGRWAGMWQFVTVRRGKGKPDPAAVLGLPIAPLKRLGTVTHDLTHRRYEFAVFVGNTCSQACSGTRRWATRSQMQDLPFPKPHLAIAAMLGDLLAE